MILAVMAIRWGANPRAKNPRTPPICSRDLHFLLGAISSSAVFRSIR